MTTPPLNLFGEPEPAEVPAKPMSAKIVPVKPLMSSDYYTLLRVSEMLKTDPEHAYQILRFHDLQSVPTATSELWPCFERKPVEAVVTAYLSRKAAHRARQE